MASTKDDDSPGGSKKGKVGGSAGIEPGHRAFWELGRRIEAAITEAGSKKAAVRLLVQREGVSYDLARKALAFAERFGRADLVRLGRMRIRGGEPLAQDYLRRLAMVEDAQMRE